MARSRPQIAHCRLSFTTLQLALRLTFRSLHIAATKEPSLFLFHALGKVLFNKRWGENREEDEKSQRVRPPDDPEMPEHLSKWKRRPSKVDVNVSFWPSYLC